MRLKLLAVIIVPGLLLTSCTGDSAEKKEHLIRVNAYTISSDEVDSRLKLETELTSNLYISEDTRVVLVKHIIQSQLLIQEAKKQKLDQEEIFRQTIQRYWESTLIRDLLAKKGAHFRKTTVVTQEEINEYYRSNNEFLPEGMLEERQPELVKKIEDKKVEAKMASWIAELKAGAKIEIKDPGLATKVNSTRNDG